MDLSDNSGIEHKYHMLKYCKNGNKNDYEYDYDYYNIFIVSIR